MTEDDVHLDGEDVLTGLAADFVSEARLADHLKRLLENPPGQWTRVGSLIPDEWKQIGDGQLPEPRVTWLPLPDSAYGSGYATVVFFEEELHWHALSLVNRDLVVGQ